ncbi:MAG: hypothetical protein LBG08_07805, partial [Spirochaetaceae bacterium]|nr:hypothetical protein [Spirochaetaceae bacterium]
MKRIVCLTLTALLLAGALFAAGGREAQSANSAEVTNLLKKYFPDQMKDGAIRIAVVRNLNPGDHTQQFLEGCVSEGRALGFEVDTFVTNGDNVLCQQTLEQVINNGQKNYDGIILSHGEGGYTYNSLKPAV